MHSPELKFCMALARKAGKNILNGFNINVARQYKPDNTPITAADVKNNELAIEEISLGFPGIAVIAEEGNLDSGSEIKAVVDPLDGSIPFANGIPTCVFSLALVERGLPFLAVIYDPFLDRMFVAEKGKGSFLNGSRIYVPKQKRFAREIMGMGFVREQRNLIDLQKHLIGEGSYVISLLTSVYSGAMVSCGSFAASIYPVKYPWDGAGVKLLVEEAGGRVTDLYGNDQRWDQKIDGCLGANPWLHEKLVELANKLVPKN